MEIYFPTYLLRGEKLVADIAGKLAGRVQLVKVDAPLDLAVGGRDLHLVVGGGDLHLVVARGDLDLGAGINIFIRSHIFHPIPVWAFIEHHFFPIYFYLRGGGGF